jgi:uncharacterized RDD family membrane protein YckC
VFYIVVRYKFREIEEKAQKVGEDEKKSLIEYAIISLFCMLLVALLLFQIVDLCMFGNNKYRDGNTVPLEEW